MSTKIDKESCEIDRLKEYMSYHKITIRRISEETGVPYGSLQTYFSGKHAMPISVFMKICSFLDVSADWVLFGKQPLKLEILSDAIEKIFGDALPSPSRAGYGIVEMKSAPKSNRSIQDIRHDCTTAALLISLTYDKLKESEYFSSLRSEFFQETEINFKGK